MVVVLRVIDAFYSIRYQPTSASAAAWRRFIFLGSIGHDIRETISTSWRPPSQGQSFSGTKIAFTRIPDVDEFLE
jgi:hypothetical protein